MFTKTCATVLGLMFAAGANAGMIEYSDLTEGTSHADLLVDGVDVDVDSSPRNFQFKTTNGTTGAGVQGGSVSGEIDNDEYIEISFPFPVFVTSFSVGQLYANGNFGDNPDEVAMLITAGPTSFDLSVTSPTTATWSGNGSVSNVSIADNSGGGEWLVSGDNLFGVPVSSVRFMSGNVGNAVHSDFTFVSLGFRVIPTPGSLALAGLGGLMCIRRKR